MRTDDPTTRIDDPTMRTSDPTTRIGDPTMRIDDPTTRIGDPTTRIGDPQVRTRDPRTRRGAVPCGIIPSPMSAILSIYDEAIGVQAREPRFTLRLASERVTAREIIDRREVTFLELVPLVGG